MTRYRTAIGILDEGDPRLRLPLAPVALVGDRKFLFLGPTDAMVDMDGFRIVSDRLEVYNVCEHCNRFDTRKIEARTFDEAVEKGLAVEVLE